ncbi:MAG: hypothetical protein HXS40_05965 [Theionarchaea archaeon]|nr:hypothetical protein [Theionarchaea archaeon]
MPGELEKLLDVGDGEFEAFVSLEYDGESTLSSPVFGISIVRKDNKVFPLLRFDKSVPINIQESIGKMVLAFLKSRSMDKGSIDSKPKHIN